MPGAAKRPFGGIWNKGSRSGLGMFADGGEMHAECAAPNGAKAFLSYFLCPTKSREKVAARTCKKLPVASFCASETAETGRIANGREQGDHVSRRRKKDLIWFVRICCFGALIRGLQNLEAPCKGNGFILFASCKKNQKAHQRFANLWTPGTIQIAGRYMIVVKVTGVHQVTGFAKSCNFAGYRRQ